MHVDEVQYNLTTSSQPSLNLISPAACLTLSTTKADSTTSLDSYQFAISLNIMTYWIADDRPPCSHIR